MKQPWRNSAPVEFDTHNLTICNPFPKYFEQALGNAALSKTSSKGNSNLNASNPDRGTEDQPVHVVMNPPKGLCIIELF